MILLQGHAVTLTFKVATQILRVHIVHIASYACTKFHAPSFNNFKVIKGSRFLADRQCSTGRGLIILFNDTDNCYR